MKLAHVILFAKDMAKLTAFYRDTLGLTVVEESPTWVVLDAGGTQLALHAIPAEIAARIAISDPPKRRGDTPLKLGFVADPATVERLGMSGDCVDPEGNVFRITAA